MVAKGRRLLKVQADRSADGLRAAAEAFASSNLRACKQMCRLLACRMPSIYMQVARANICSRSLTGNNAVITVKTVEHVARLARLSLTAEEKERFARQLGNIIEHFNELQNIDTTNIEPMAHVLPITNVMREDAVVTPPGSAALLQTAPASENGFFRVPKIGES